MAELGLKPVSMDFLHRAGRRENFFILALLFILLAATVLGVANVLTGPDWGSLWKSLLLGLLFGWSLAFMRWTWWKPALFILLAGVIINLLSAGDLAEKALGLLLESFRLPIHILRAPDISGADLSALSSAGAKLASSASIVVSRIDAWLKALLSSRASFDPIAAKFVWSVLIWMVAAWAGWIIETSQNALLAVLPALLVNLSTLSFGKPASSPILLILGSTLVLIAIVQFKRLEQGWENNNIAFPSRKYRRVASSAIAIASALVILSAFISMLSYQRITDWIANLRRPPAQHETGLAKSLGIQPAPPVPDAFSTLRSPGLPRNMLIGSGPELSGELVMSVEVKNLPEVTSAGQSPSFYWRSFTYDIYTGHGWSTSATKQDAYPADTAIQSSQLPDHFLVDQVIRPAGSHLITVYATGEPVSVSVPSSAAWRSSNDLFGIQAGGQGYEIVSLVPMLDEARLRSAGEVYPDWVRQRYLELPAGVPGRVKELAFRLTATEPTPYDRARAIEKYLRQYQYTLDVSQPPANQDLVDYFLFDLRKGYCDYYASAMVVLARAAGIPARLAVGYASGTYNLSSNLFMVTQADAHSWVEVYFPGTGWVPFEPTASRPIVDRSTSVVPQASPTATPGKVINPLKAGKPFRQVAGYLGLALVIVAGSGWAVYDELHLRRLGPGKTAAEIYRRMRRYGNLLGVNHQPGETPFEFSAQLNASMQNFSLFTHEQAARSNIARQAQSIIQQLVRLIYRPSEEQAGQARQVVAQWKSLRWKLRRTWVSITWNELARIIWVSLAQALKKIGRD